MLDAAQQGDYAYPAVNVTSIVTINAALKAFADAKSDGIIQFSTGGGQFASGLNVKDAVHGCIVLAEATHRLAEKYDILIGLHTTTANPRRRRASSSRSSKRPHVVAPTASPTSSRATCSMPPSFRLRKT